jgi:hypothetical protein
VVRLTNFLNYVFKTLKTSILRPFKLVQRKLKKNLFFKSKVAKAIKTNVKETVKVVKKAPDQPSDYVLIGNRYYAKRLVVVGIVGAVALYFLIVLIVYPFARGRLFTPTAVLSESYLPTFSGKIKLVNREGILVYDGTFADGACDGEGVQFDDSGQKVYEGAFKADRYDGEGTLYGEGGQVIYEGGFAANLFSGDGKAYAADGRLYYEGQFENGVYQGAGKLYKNAKILYAGDFMQGLKNGYGVTYDENGMVRHAGYYQNGLYQGEGTLYNADGQRIYSGAFVGGLFEGYGKLYYDSGALAYDGSFVQGMYTGDGSLYSEDGALQYQGTFASGKFSGDGILYNQAITYTGHFENGLYDGEGVLTKSGQRIYKGQFKEGSADLFGLIGADSTALAETFGDDGVIDIYDGVYTVYYENADALVVLSMPEDDSAPVILRIFDRNAALLPMAENVVRDAANDAVWQYDVDTWDWFYKLVGKSFGDLKIAVLEAEAETVNVYYQTQNEGFLFYEITTPQ